MKLFLLYILWSGIMISCRSHEAEESTEQPETITPVTITSITNEPLTEYLELNATSTFLQKAFIKASSNGYIQSVNAQIGELVSGGRNVFILKTKEAESIGNTINLLDSSFKFTGVINIKAGINGYISEINHQPGDYVQEGEQLAVINDVKSFVFILNLPYEWRPFVLNKNIVDLLLPDGKIMPGYISKVMPVVDSASQTQSIMVTVKDKNLPANLIAKVRVIKTTKPNAVTLPKQAVLSNESQSAFWVMKLMDDSTAIKIPVNKGIELDERTEILSPQFSASDKFLLNGNYGLPDTAKIRIVKE